MLYYRTYLSTPSRIGLFRFARKNLSGILSKKIDILLTHRHLLRKPSLKRKAFIVNHQRPVNLDLSSLQFPPMAILSILHRISGVVLFLLLPLMLYLFHLASQSEDSFVQLGQLLLNPFLKLCVWAFSSSFVLHVLAGIRHLFMDLGFGEHLHQARQSAIFILACAVLSIIVLGFYIW